MYDACGTVCQDTCLDPNGSNDCQEPCIETCLCPSGLFYEGNQCIHPSDCGCLLESGLYLSVSREIGHFKISVNSFKIEMLFGRDQNSMLDVWVLGCCQIAEISVIVL